MEMRSALHYPSTWLTVVDLMQRGFRIGLASEAIFMMRYEDALDLSIPDARIKLGVRNAEDIDTVSDDEVFCEKRPPTREELETIGWPELAKSLGGDRVRGSAGANPTESNGRVRQGLG
jgi:ubiquinone biosynthesis protein COQ4